jgi:O-antigen ligase
MAARLRSPDYVGPAVLLAFAALVGLIAGVEPKLALVAAIGSCFALLLFVNFQAGVAVFAFLSFLEVLNLGSSATVGKLGGGLVILAWIALLATRREDEQFFEAHPTITLVLAAYLAWIALGYTWAVSPSDVVTALTRYIPNVLLIPIMYTAIRNKRQAMWVMAALVLGALAASLYGITHTSPEDARIEGTALDPNELASVLVAGTALTAAIAANLKNHNGLRFAALVCIGLCVFGIFLTVSRGGLVALAVALVAAMILGGRWRPLAFVAAILIGCGSFYYFAVLAPPEARERITKTSEGETQVKEGRTTLWQVAERIVKAKPITGVGANNFQDNAHKYVLTQPGPLARTDLVIASPRVVHNTYLGMGAELGLVGLGLFIVVVLFCIGSTIRAARFFSALGDRGGEALARGLAVGLIGTLVADFFISEEYNKPLWLLLGLGPAILGVAQRQMKAAREREDVAL